MLNNAIFLLAWAVPFLTCMASYTCHRPARTRVGCSRLLILRIMLQCRRHGSQQTDHMEQSTACTTCTRSVTEHFQTCAEDTPVLDCPAPLRRFVISAPFINARTCLLTCFIYFTTVIVTFINYTSGTVSFVAIVSTLRSRRLNRLMLNWMTV